MDILIEESGGKGALGPVILGVKALLGPSVVRRASTTRTLDRLADESPPLG